MGSAGGDADGRTGDDEGTRRWCRTGRRSCRRTRSKRRRRPTRDIGRVIGVSAPAHIDTCHTVSTRYGDLDPNGHVNNVAIAQLYEDARARLSRELLDATVPGSVGSRGFVVATIGIHYRRSILCPGEVAVGIGVTRIGCASFSCGYGIFVGDECAGTLDAVMVLTSNGAATALSSDIRIQLERLRFAPVAS
jgi:acyl-CoA thioester hydrolase